MLNKSAIAGRIKDVRGELSQRQFAEILNFKQTYVSEIETGKTKPSIDFLMAMKKEFNTQVDFVLTGDPASGERPFDPLHLALKDFAGKLIQIQKL